KVGLRLIPFLVLCYFISYVDRVNVGFAALTMNKDLGLSAAAFGIGGGLFFVAYVMFEVPSNLAMEKVGARLWIARIMITWGLVEAQRQFGSAGHSGHGSVWSVLTIIQVWLLAIIYVGSSATSNTLSLWMPQILKGFGLGDLETGLLNMVPFGIASVFMIFCG